MRALVLFIALVPAVVFAAAGMGRGPTTTVVNPTHAAMCTGATDGREFDPFETRRQMRASQCWERV